jgi:hypothetical protein
MSLPTFFRINKNRRFNYIPRYYDADKEELQERIQAMERELGITSDGEYKPYIRKGLMSRRAISYKREKVKAKSQSNFRLVVILIILLTISYFLFIH